MSYLFKYLNHYLLITLTVSFIIGLTLSFHYPNASLPLSAVVIICSIVLLLLLLNEFNERVVLLLAVCFVLTGYYHGKSNSSPFPKSGDISHYFHEPREAIVLGTLSRMATQQYRGQKVIVDVSFLLLERSQMIPVSGQILLRIDDVWPGSILPGDAFITRGLFKKPDPVMAPTSFDYAGYLADRNIYLTGTIQSPLLINKIEPHTRGDYFSRFFYAFERTRNTVSLFLSSSLSEEHASLYQALLLGDKSRISPELLDGFRKSGVMHILAISGMHMALLGFLLFSIFYFTARLSSTLILAVNVKKMSLLLCIVPLFLYTLMAGSNTPVVRSFTMSLIFILAFCFNRTKSHLTILSVAALVLLVANPLVLKTASFQLSFAAVASIVLITPKLLHYLPSLQHSATPRRIMITLAMRCIQLAAVTISATVGTIPLLIYHFNQLSSVTLIANLVVEPLICLWALPSGFIGVILIFIFPYLADTVFHFGTYSLDIVTDFTLYLSSLTLSTIWVPDIPIVLILIYYGALLLLIADTSHRFRIFALPLLTISLALSVAPVTGITNSFRHTHSVSFIDVGQGSSTLIQLSGGRTIVVDGGATTTPGFDCGERIIAPYLWSRGIGHIDDIVLTHDDADHYNGISALLERFRPSRLWIPEFQSEKPGYNALISKARRRGVKIVTPQQGIFISSEHATLSRIKTNQSSMKSNFPLDQVRYDNNDKSLIVSLRTRDFSILLPGDISSDKERSLIQTDSRLEHDILLSPHHGSSTSNSPGFLTAVNPRYLIVSAGKSGKSLFPSSQTRKSADSMGIELLTTNRDGTIIVRGKNGDFEMQTTAY